MLYCIVKGFSYQTLEEAKANEKEDSVKAVLTWYYKNFNPSGGTVEMETMAKAFNWPNSLTK